MGASFSCAFFGVLRSFSSGALTSDLVLLSASGASKAGFSSSSGGGGGGFFCCCCFSCGFSGSGAGGSSCFGAGRFGDHLDGGFLDDVRRFAGGAPVLQEQECEDAQMRQQAQQEKHEEARAHHERAAPPKGVHG